MFIRFRQTSVILGFLCGFGLLLTACLGGAHYELNVRSEGVVAPGDTVELAVSSTNPPPGLRYVWYAPHGEFNPQDSSSPATIYTAPIEGGDYQVKVEVKKGEETVFTDARVIKVIGQEGTVSNATPATLPQSTSSEGLSTTSKPAIRFSQIPVYDDAGGPAALEPIGGEVTGVNPKLYKIVLYAYTDYWYVQPFVADPLTDLEADGKFSTQSHLGSKYAALLVKPSFTPRSVTQNLPGVGGDVLAVTTVTGKK